MDPTENGSSILAKSSISLLQELCLQKAVTPRYELVQIEGKVHMPTFKMQVVVGEGLVATGSGPSKQKAKHAAAKAMLDKMKEASVSDVASDVSGIASSIENLQIRSPNEDNIPGNPVGDLLVFCNTHNLEAEYILIEESGPPHDRFFEMRCSVAGYTQTGSGKTKKLAKRQAAHSLLIQIKDLTEETLAASQKEQMVATKTTIQTQVPKLNLKFSNGPLLATVQNKAKYDDMVKSNAIQLLNAIGLEQRIVVTFNNADEKSGDNFCCFVHIDSQPNVVCFGKGESPDLAQIDAARNTLEYLRIVTKSR